MKMQWRLVVALLFAVIIALFAVINVKLVPVFYLFGVAYVPLILLILGSALVGALCLFFFGIVYQLRVSRERRQLEKQLQTAEQQLALLVRKEEESARIVESVDPEGEDIVPTTEHLQS